MQVACYDGDGLRASFSTSSTELAAPHTESFTWDPTGSLPHSLMDSDNAYIYGPGNTPLEQVDLTSGDSSYLVSDLLGSVRGVVDGSAGILDRDARAYDAWGNPETTGGLTADTPFGYAGVLHRSDRPHLQRLRVTTTHRQDSSSRSTRSRTRRGHRTPMSAAIQLTPSTRWGCSRSI